MADEEPLFRVPGWTPGGPSASAPTDAGGSAGGGNGGFGNVVTSRRLGKGAIVGAIVGVIAAVVVVVIAVVVVTQSVGPDQTSGTGQAAPQTDSTQLTATTTSDSMASSDTPPLGNAGTDDSITFDRMRDFSYMQYGELPGNPSETWQRFDPNLANRTGWPAYVDFWNSIASVRVLSVSPRDASSVVVRLRYETRSGSTDVEDRWLSFVASNGELRIFDSQRIGSVG